MLVVTTDVDLGSLRLAVHAVSVSKSVRVARDRKVGHSVASLGLVVDFAAEQQNVWFRG